MVVMIVRDNTEPYTPRIQITPLIKPDMLINTYSLFDYWIKRLCENKKKIYNLDVEWETIKKGKHDLHTFHKYLTKYVEINLDDLIRDYQGIDDLRRVRNKCIHAGGHVVDEREVSKMKNIKGITIDLGTIVIHDEFVWSSLEHVKKYLIGIAER